MYFCFVCCLLRRLAIIVCLKPKFKLNRIMCWSAISDVVVYGEMWLLWCNCNWKIILNVAFQFTKVTQSSQFTDHCWYDCCLCHPSCHCINWTVEYLKQNTTKVPKPISSKICVNVAAAKVLVTVMVSLQWSWYLQSSLHMCPSLIQTPLAMRAARIVMEH